MVERRAAPLRREETAAVVHPGERTTRGGQKNNRKCVLERTDSARSHVPALSIDGHRHGLLDDGAQQSVLVHRGNAGERLDRGLESAREREEREREDDRR